MSDWPTREMIDAAVPFYDRALKISPVAAWSIGRLQAANMIRAALDAAPKVDGWVWCGKGIEDGVPWGVTQSTFCVNALTLRNPDHACPGPHRSLIIGPEVSSG